MNFTKILAALKSERARLDQAIAAIESIDSTGRRRGRPAGTTAPERRRRRMSAAARKRIAAAQKARWAAWRKRAKAT